MTNCTQELFHFSSFDRRKIEASFTGGDVSSDGGIFLLRQADRRLGFTAALDRVLPDPRNPHFIVHRQINFWRDLRLFPDAPSSSNQQTPAWLRYSIQSDQLLGRASHENHWTK